MRHKPDPDPPSDILRLSPDHSLKVRWYTDSNGTVRAELSSFFLTEHGGSFVLWSTVEAGTQANRAFHVRFPGGLRGEARRQLSSMGMVALRRPWRRRRDNSWWPGDLLIFPDHVQWRDHDALLTLWAPPANQVQHLLRDEFGPDGLLRGDQFHWPELYIALCGNARFLDAVRDNDFAASVFAFFANHKIYRLSDNRWMLVGSDRRYGDMLGAWRRCGESYLDFFADLDGTAKSEHTEAIVEMLRGVGYEAIMESLD